MRLEGHHPDRAPGLPAKGQRLPDYGLVAAMNAVKIAKGQYPACDLIGHDRRVFKDFHLSVPTVLILAALEPATAGHTATCSSGSQAAGGQGA
jgi:hypothetical protein